MTAAVVILVLLVVLVATDGDSRNFDPTKRGSLIPMKTPAHAFSPAHSYLRSKACAVSFSLLGITALVLAALLLIGYTTMQSVLVPARSGPSTAAQVSNDVEAATKNSQTLMFQVTQIEPTALTSKDVQVNYEHIAGMQIKRTDKLRTTASAIGVILLIGLAYVLTHIGPGMAGPESLGL
jgi:hypothetical protein